RKDKLERMPLYRKAIEILDIVERIRQLVPEENEFTATVAQNMYADALQLAPKIAGAEAVDLYDIKMENAAIIRKCARELYVGRNGYVIEGATEVEYLRMLRAEVEEFRVVFAGWVRTFDQWNYILRRWELFHPSGVNYGYTDPAEDIPLDNLLHDFDDWTI